MQPFCLVVRTYLQRFGWSLAFLILAPSVRWPLLSGSPTAIPGKFCQRDARRLSLVIARRKPSFGHCSGGEACLGSQATLCLTNIGDTTILNCLATRLDYLLPSPCRSFHLTRPIPVKIDSQPCLTVQPYSFKISQDARRQSSRLQGQC